MPAIHRINPAAPRAHAAKDVQELMTPKSTWLRRLFAAVAVGLMLPGLVAVAFFAVLVVVYFAAVRHHAQLDESAFQEAHDATGSVPMVAPPRRRR